MLIRPPPSLGALGGGVFVGGRRQTLEVDVAGFPLCRVPHVSGYWPNAPSLRGVQSTHVEYAVETGRPGAERA